MAFSVTRLAKDLSISRADASSIRAAMLAASDPDDVLEVANVRLNGYGIEAVRGDVWVDAYYGDIVALYVNVGETYAFTLLYETARDRWVLSDVGSWVERNERRYRIL